MSAHDGQPGTPPWWASGAEDLDDAVDPLAAHRAARAADDATDREADDEHAAGGDHGWDAWEDWDARDADPPPGAVRSTLEDAIDGLALLARLAGRRQAGGRDRRGHDPACRGCPWCTVLRSLGDARPEVTEHLEQAMHHLVQAARAWVDAADDRSRWRPIPIDDEEPT